jgi:hypothetical protein
MNHRLDFYFDEQPRIDECRHLDERVGRWVIVEELVVDLASLAPLGDVGQVDARADDVRALGIQVGKCPLDDLHAPSGLGIDVPGCVHLALIVDRRRPGYEYAVADSHRTAIPV